MIRKETPVSFITLVVMRIRHNGIEGSKEEEEGREILRNVSNISHIELVLNQKYS
jgi:hypothetical protein